MTQEKPLIQFGAPHVGDGNLLVLDVLTHALEPEYQFVETSQTITSIPAALWHEHMTSGNSPYAESLRSSPLSAMLGCLLALEGAIRRHDQPARIGIFTQELQLTLLALFPQLIPHYYNHLYLLIPDAKPKHNALPIMQRLKDHLTPVVWNHDAYTDLHDQGLNPLLTTSFLTPLRDQDILAAQKHQPRYSVIKGSGSGLPTTLRNLALELVNPALPFLEISRTRSAWNHPAGTTHHYSRTQLADIPRDIALASEIFIYPNEFTALLIYQISQGWLGLVNFFYPRGQHEHDNITLFARTGYPFRILAKDGSVHQVKPKCHYPQEFAQRAQQILGTSSLAEAMRQDMSNYLKQSPSKLLFSNSSD